MVDDNVFFDVDEVNDIVLFVVSWVVVDVVDGTDVEVTKRLCGATIDQFHMVRMTSFLVNEFVKLYLNL